MEITSVLTIIALLALISTAAIFQLSAMIWTAGFAVALIAVAIYGLLPISIQFLFWLGFLTAAGFAHLHGYRRQYITGPMLTQIKQRMPSISATEQEAIEAGNTWWEKELFCGRPDWKKLLALPTPALTSEEQQFINGPTEQLCQMLNDWQITHEDNDLPPEVWSFIKKEKFMGLVIPKQYDGLGFSALAHSTIIAKIATRSISAAVNIMVPNSLGPAELMLHYGTDNQKNHYLPRLARGEEIPCFALTAPTAGSDASNIPDTGIICKGTHEGRSVIGMRLNWDKRYITLAPIATILGLAVHVYDPDNLLGQGEDVGITLCVIPTNHPGVEIGTRHIPLQMAFMNGPTRGQDVFIPLDWIIGGKENVGKGWRMLMECLSIGRSISLPALATASCKVAYRFTGAYARLRKQFKTSLSSFEGIEESLGRIAGITYLLEAARIMTASAIDTGINPATVSAIAKYQMTEMGRLAINSAMDIHAGHMIQIGPRNLLAKFHFSMPICITVEGANILTRNRIIFGQGAIRCHPYLLKEIALLSQPQMDIVALDKVLMSHVGFFASNLIRALAYGLTGGKLIFAPSQDKAIKKYERQLTRMSAALAFAADTCLILLGGSLKRRERISARLADILSQLYLASAALKYYNNHAQTDAARDYLRWSLQYCLNNIQQAFNELFINMPNRWIGRLMKWIIFPLGQAYHFPNDQLTRKLVTEMVQPGQLRDQITEYCYISPDKNELSFRLEAALKNAAEYDELRKKLQKALQSGMIPEYYSFKDRLDAAEKAGIFSKEEAQKLQTYESLCDEIIKVNEFSFDLEQVVA